LKINEHFDTLPSFRGLCPRILFTYVRVSLAFVLMKGGDDEKKTCDYFYYGDVYCRFFDLSACN